MVNLPTAETDTHETMILLVGHDKVHFSHILLQKSIHHNIIKAADSPNLSGIMVWITLQNKEIQVTEAVAGRKGNT